MHGKPVAATVRKLHRTPRLLLDEDERQHSEARHRLTPTPRRTTTIQTQPARKASALREPSPVPGTPRHDAGPAAGSILGFPGGEAIIA